MLSSPLTLAKRSSVASASDLARSDVLPVLGVIVRSCRDPIDLYFFADLAPAGAVVSFRIDAAGTGTATPNWPEIRSATESR